MKKIFNKIKASLVVFWVALISFPLKVKGLEIWEWKNPNPQPDYGIYYPSEKLLSSPANQITTPIDTIIKTAPRLLVAITFIVGIISFIKIRKIDDKSLKKKKIKKTIIIISVLIILVVSLLLLPQILNKSVSNALF